MAHKEEANQHHIVSLKTYLTVGIALMFLTAVTVAVSFINLGGWNAVVAVVIASIKATLVALIFMHLYYDRKIYLVIFITALLFLTIFIALTMFDTVSRGHIDEIMDKPINNQAEMYNEVNKDVNPAQSDSLSDSTETIH
ncbi:MAG: hypothetical protein GY855_05330 [candidate division Zixibacteria bacterium]|nr:hypothetical protein [candidate division Zixibacteria bacterium]